MIFFIPQFFKEDQILTSGQLKNTKASNSKQGMDVNMIWLNIKSEMDYVSPHSNYEIHVQTNLNMSAKLISTRKLLSVSS